jgi:hypothetical protein
MAEVTVLEQAGALTQEKLTYRKFVKLGTDAQGATTIEKKAVKSESDKKEPALLDDGTPNPHAGVAVSWAGPTKEGFTLFNENDFIRYQVKSWAGAETLVPDEAQRVYIFQYGLNAIQTARAIGFMDELKEGESEPTPVHDGEVIDLKDSINEQPQRRSTSEIDKFVKQADAYLAAMGIPESARAETIAKMLASMQPVTEDEGTEEVS